MSNDQREFEVIVWGASGFTGRLVAEYLYERYGTGEDLRWALAGRNLAKLESVRRNLGDAAGKLPVITGDSHDSASLAVLVRRAKVVCTTVGPYAKYGSELVRACAENGTHYCDLAGEVQWMRKMIDAHESRAKTTGARIVHACGFDSIPSDMGVLFLQDQALAQRGKYCSHVKYRLKAARGGPSGGTAASLLNAVEEARQSSEIAKILVHPYSLNPEGERHGPDRADQKGVVYDEDLNAWTAPFVMASINTKIVRRTNALTGYRYGRNFRYEEATLMGDGIAGWLKGAALSAGLGSFMIAAAIGPVRSLVNRLFLPQPGEGPSRKEREHGFYDIVFVGKFDDGTAMRARVKGDRDPGYGSTSKMLAESAVCLCRDDALLSVDGGFWTPASAMGRALLDRLQRNAGLSFTIE